MSNAPAPAWIRELVEELADTVFQRRTMVEGKARLSRNALEAFGQAVAVRVQPQWRLIEQAPKDGTEILLTNGRYKRTGYWAKRINAWSVDTAVSMDMPTHWMSLPEALEGPR